MYRFELELTGQTEITAETTQMLDSLTAGIDLIPLDDAIIPWYYDFNINRDLDIITISGYLQADTQSQTLVINVPLDELDSVYLLEIECDYEDKDKVRKGLLNDHWRIKDEY